MPNHRRPEYDSPEFHARWHSHETIESLADWLGVTVAMVWKAAQHRGFQTKLEWRANNGA